MKFLELIDNIKQVIVMEDREFNTKRVEQFCKQFILVKTDDQPEFVVNLNHQSKFSGRRLVEKDFRETTPFTIHLLDKTTKGGIGFGALIFIEDSFWSYKNGGKIDSDQTVFAIRKDSKSDWDYPNPSNISSEFIDINSLIDKTNILKMYKLFVEDNSWAFTERTKKLLKKIK